MVAVPFVLTAIFAPLGSVTVRPETDEVELHIGAEISQQLHCVELATFAALITKPPALRKKSATFDDDCEVIPAPDVDEVIVPLPRIP